MPSVKIENISKIILFLLVALVSILTAVAYFVTDVPAARYSALGLVFGTALFVFVEVGYFGGFKAKDPWRISGVIVAFVAILGVVLQLVPMFSDITILSSLQGFISVLLAIFFVVEGFR